MGRGLLILVLLTITCQITGTDGHLRRQNEAIMPLPNELAEEDDATLPVNEKNLGIVMNQGNMVPTNNDRLKQVQRRLEKLKGKMKHKNTMEAEIRDLEKQTRALQRAIQTRKNKKQSQTFTVSDKLKQHLINIGSPLVQYLNDSNENKGKNKVVTVAKRTVYVDVGQMWTKGIIPYLLDAGLPDSWRSAALQYMNEWQAVTAYRFVPYTPTVHVDNGLGHNTTLQFIYSTGCWSYVGRLNTNIQTISPCGGSAAAHELGHTLGLAHEQSNAYRDSFVRINWDNINPSYASQFNKETGSNWLSLDYDYSSLMHYGLWDFNSNNQKVMTVLDKRLEYMILTRYEMDYFYPAYEVQLVLKLNETLCPNFAIVCYNGGYLSYVNGKCQCRCPFPFNSADGCQTLETNAPMVTWPADSFAFLRPVQGCPAGFTSGTVKRFKDPKGYTSTISSDFHASGEYNVYAYVREDFCVKDATFNGSQTNQAKWGPGSYCIHRKGGSCPLGFDAGSIMYDDAEARGNTTVTGTLPDGIYINGTKYEFCCRNDGPSNIPIELPRSMPFTMYTGPSGSCQEVKGMRNLKERYQFYNTDASTFTSRTGSYPYIYVYTGSFTRLWNIYFCFYYPVDYACGGIYSASNGNPVTITSPNYPLNYDNSKRCTWVVKGPTGTKLRLNFDKLDIKTAADGSCEDLLEIRHSLPGHRGFLICGNGYRNSLITETNYLILTLSTDFSNTATGFNATIDVVTDTMLNYVNQGIDGAYDGKVNVTRNLDVCLPWTDIVGKCPYSPMDIAAVPDDLDSNFCRNPGTGLRPWCYTNVDQCIRDYCDVSYLEKCIDQWTDCAELLTLETDFCTKYVNGDAWKCAKTCGKCDTIVPVLPASSITCGPPSTISDGDYTPKKSSYAVGEKVQYLCTGGSDENTRTCGSEGAWVPDISFVCGVPTEKGDGWTIFQGFFYKYFAIDSTYQSAEAYCASMKASVSTAKTIDENNYIYSLVPWGDYIWLGMSDAEVEGVWKWNDGTLVTWSNWDSGQPDNWYNEDNAYMRYWNGKWNDDDSMDKNGFVCKRAFDARKVCADQSITCTTLIEKVPDMRVKYSTFASQRCPRTTGLCTDTDVKGEMPCNSSTPSASCAVCLDPGNVLYATKVRGGASITVGEVFEVTCNSGYTLTQGNLIRACLPSGSLTGSAPVCQLINLTPTKVSSISTRKRDNVLAQKTFYSGDNAYHRISKAGEIYEWQFYSYVNGKIAFQVWRRNGLSFMLVGQNIIDKARDDRLRRVTIASGTRIAVQPNDLIGFMYVGAANGGVTYDDCVSSLEPEGINLFSSSVTYSDPSLILVGQNVTFKALTSCRIFSFTAIVGPIQLK